jgi:hypothetical protein
MAKLNSFAELANTELGSKSKPYLTAVACIKNTKTIALAARLLADVFEKENPWAREIIGRENIERFTLEYVRKVAHDMNNPVRSSAPKRVEDGGHHAVVEKAIPELLPSSPQSTRSKADAQPEAKANRETAGHSLGANGQKVHAQPSREPVDERGGQAATAKGPTSAALSPSPKSSLLGHNRPPKEKVGPVFDPAKLIEATTANKQQIARTWYLSDGKIPYKLPFSELLIRAKDGGDCRVLIEASTAKYANALDDMAKTPEDLLTAEEISACQEKAKQFRAAALELVR